MSILSRYLLRTYLPAFSLALGVFLSILLMNYFLRLFNVAVMKGVSLGWIFYCFVRLLPYFLSLALPMAFLVALMLTLGQLSESGEVMALRSSGFSFREILAPYFFVALGLTGLLLYINHKASPDGFHAFKKAYADVVSSVSRLRLEARTFTRLGEWEFYADEADAQGRLKGVRLIKRAGQYQRLRVSAPEGEARPESGRGVRLTLRDGALLWPSDAPSELTSSTFGTYRLFLPFVDPNAAQRRADIPELSTARLLDRLREAGVSDQHQREYTTEIALRSAAAAAPFV
ncbi:MAG: LptF/LptG family permease, partial [Elusimicrobia bacterium]|nr:LptF/LptG family permease [Elusimicrobiota bacterium]